MEDGDDWLALDKLYHIIFCFCISIVCALLASWTRYPFIRRRSIWVGSIISLLAGAAKEAADELGYFKSAGASSKDFIADLLGIILAALLLSVYQKLSSSVRLKPDASDQTKILEMV